MFNSNGIFFPAPLRYVCIAMEAMEQLLLACHCQSINLLVESFLSTLRLLLEADKPHLHILATNSVCNTLQQWTAFKSFEILVKCLWVCSKGNIY